MVNPSSKGLYVPFSTQIKYVTEKFRLFLENKEECLKIFEGNKELVKAMHGYAIGYLRHMRAFNLNPSFSMAELISDFLEILLNDPYESLTKLKKLELAFESAADHLSFKAEKDENLQ